MNKKKVTMDTIDNAATKLPNFKLDLISSENESIEILSSGIVNCSCCHLLSLPL